MKKNDFPVLKGPYLGQKSPGTTPELFAPAKMPPIINTDRTEIIHSITNNCSIYFSRIASYSTNFTSDKRNGIYISQKQNGQYTEPEKLDENFSSLDVFVASDESYMIFEKSKDKHQSDIFISYKMKDNSWSEGIKIYFLHKREVDQLLMNKQRESLPGKELS